MDKPLSSENLGHGEGAERQPLREEDEDMNMVLERI